MIYSKKANNTLFQSFVAVGSRIAQFLLNTDELIVFGHAVANLLLAMRSPIFSVSFTQLPQSFSSSPSSIESIGK